MEEVRGSERRWLRPLGLFLVVLALGIGHPLILVGVPFILLALVVPGGRLRSLILGAALLILLFPLPGPSGDGLWFAERGWAILAGGGFLALSWGWPQRSMLERGLLAVAGAFLSAVLILAGFGGTGRIQALVDARLERGAQAAGALLGSFSGEGEGEFVGALAETLGRTAEIQGQVFPALLGLATLAALGTAWWLYVRASAGSDAGLSPLARFRFPDPLIWVFIVGLGLILAFGWSGGPGRVGLNLVVFMAGLYAFRGAGVVLALSGGLSLPAMLLLAVTAALVPPVLAFGAMVIGVGDSWFDLRARGAADESAGSG
ncbi:MAG: DUF2232 domain-containing protein [Gemmatimonadales bacterium]|nr:MAG: DUF2232 domain-containing protein [Gemmatimonadales bacterium]